MTARVALIGVALYVVTAGIWLLAGGIVRDQRSELLNVSYDPTRELWRDLNAVFIERYKQEFGIDLTIHQSHGGSTSQLRAVIDGLDADVVTLALWSDVDAIQRRGLIDDGWEGRFKNHSLPYYSTIVFVVRRGNPHRIHDWPDLLRAGVQVVTPNPKTSGNGKLAFLAAWGSALKQLGTEADALRFVTDLYQNHVPALDSGGRGATMTFSQKKIGDVQLAWENEAHLEVAEVGDELEVVYPPISLRAEPNVAVVDANVRRKGTREAAEAYLRFLYTDEAQEILARHHYRPIKEEVWHAHTGKLPPLALFLITDIASSWSAAQERFFADNGVFDRIYSGR